MTTEINQPPNTIFEAFDNSGCRGIVMSERKIGEGLIDQRVIDVANQASLKLRGIAICADDGYIHGLVNVGEY